MAPHSNAKQTLSGKNFRTKYFWEDPKLGILPNLPDNGSDRVLHCWPLNSVKYDRQNDVPTVQQTNQEAGVGHLRNEQIVVPAYDKLFPQTWNAKTVPYIPQMGAVSS
jgi:hypothetical protein